MIGEVIHVLDVLILLALAGAVIIGFRTGAVRQVVGFLGVVFSLVAAFVLMHPAGESVVEILNVGQTVGPLLGFITVFVLAQLTVFAAIRIAEGIIGVLHLSTVNRLLGSAIGLGKALLLLSVLFLALRAVDVPGPRAQSESLLYEPVTEAAPSAWSFVSNEVVDANELAATFRERLRQQFADRGR